MTTTPGNASSNLPGKPPVVDLATWQAALEWDTPLFRTARTQYEQALPHAEVGEAVAERLRFPERATMAACPMWTTRSSGWWRTSPRPTSRIATFAAGAAARTHP